MTDETVPTETPAAGGPTEVPSGPAVQVLAQFVRDLSFENPNAPKSLSGGPEAPTIELDVELAARTRDDGLYEVDVTLNVSAKRGDSTAFHVQLVYGGVFAVHSHSQEDVEPLLLIECPRFLFPFARQIIASATSDGGFPPFRMEPIDFGAIYMARRNQLAQSETAGNA